jgi:hypothetical protein
MNGNAAALLLISLSFATGCAPAASSAKPTGPTREATAPRPAQSEAETIAAERVRLARGVLASIAGREKEPAGQVFKNVKRLGSVPAIQLLAIMNTGYAKSLGVSCSHCHVVGEWASEAKPQKQIARDMAAMAATINSQLLPAIQHLRGPEPVVNCTTCHRGSIKPALDLP